MWSEAASRRAALVLVAGATAALAWLAYRPFLDVGFVGWDTYPMILSARIESPLDAVAVLHEELMDGRYTDGHFYRPVTSLAFGLDYARHGLEPRGFHTTDLAILVLDASLLLWLAFRLLGGLPGAALAALVFVLHPVHLEVLPVPPRRGDTLALGFVLATLLIQAPSRSGRLRSAATGILGLLAMGAKETGALVLPLVFSLHLLSGCSGGTRQAVRRAAIRTSPIALAALVYAWGRWLAVGGLGGHDESLGAALLAAPATLPQYLARLLHPQPLPESATAARVLVLGAACTLTGLAFLAWRRSRSRPGVVPPLPFLGLWLLLSLGVSSLSGRRQEWYLLLFVAPYAVLLGALLEEVRVRWQQGHTAAAAAFLALPLWLAASHLATSPLLRSYTEWDQASHVAARFLERFDRALASSRPGDVRILDGLPLRGRRPGIRPRIHSTWIFSDYSLQAYAELVDRRRVEVLPLPRTGPEAAPRDAIRVYVTPGRLVARESGSAPGLEGEGVRR